MFNYSDTAVISPSEDKLGLAPLALKLTKGLISAHSLNSIVCSIQGEWGCGKSSFLNFMSHYLQEEKKVVLRLNPWLLSGRTDIVSVMLKEISLGLKKNQKELAEKIYAYSLIFDNQSNLSLNLDQHFDIANRANTLTSLRQEIETILIKNDTKIFILIDDIDRLAHKEICEVLRLMAVVADFPNFNFIISMNRLAVENAIKLELNLDAVKYLEKIIQFPFTIPQASSAKLITLFEHFFLKIVGNSLTASNLEYAKHIFPQSLFPFLSKPRDVIRLINRFIFSYGALKKDTNPVDLAIIDYYYLHYPLVYNFIKDNEDLIIDTGASAFNDKKSIFENQMIGLFPDESERRQWIKALSALFPDLRKHKLDHKHSSYIIQEQDQTIHQDKYFFNYFAFNMEDQEVTTSLIKKFISSLSSIKEVDNFIKRFLSATEGISLSEPLDTFLVKLRDHLALDSLADEAKNTNLIGVIFKMARFSRKDTTISLKESNEKILLDLLWGVLLRLDDKQRYTVLKQNIENSPALFFNVFVIKNLGYLQKFSLTELISKEDLKIFEDKALENIQIEAQNFAILKDQHLLSILEAWHYFLRNRHGINTAEVGFLDLVSWQKDLIASKKKSGINQILKIFLKTSPDSEAGLYFDKDSFELFFNRDLFLAELKGKLSEEEALFKKAYTQSRPS